MSLTRRSSTALLLAGTSLALFAWSAPSVSGAVPAVPAESHAGARVGVDADWFIDPLTAARRRTLIAVPSIPSRYDGQSRRWTRAVHRTFDGAVAVPVQQARDHLLDVGQAVVLRVPLGYPQAPLSDVTVRQLRWLRATTAAASGLTCEGYVGYGQGSTRPSSSVSRQRATAVCRALVANRPGVTFTVVGHGDSRPVVVGGAWADRESLRAANRRVVVVMTGRATEATAPSAPAFAESSYFDGWDAYLSWTAPALDGGAAISDYEVSTDEGPWVSTGTDLQETLRPAREGCTPAPHTFLVRALNSAGPGAASAPITLDPIAPGTPTARPGARCA